MSEKFPPLEDDQIENTVVGDETDFLRREAEVLGDEFKTEQDEQIMNEFEEKYPDINDETAEIPSASPQEPASEAASGSSSGFTNPDADRIIAEWREKRAKEIEERDSEYSQAKIELQEEAVKYIDNFYDDYNKKKQQQSEVTRKEAEEFLEARDKFFVQDNTTWDRVLQLINLDDAVVLNGRDRSKFKEILQRLQGKPDAPGA